MKNQFWGRLLVLFILSTMLLIGSIKAEPADNTTTVPLAYLSEIIKNPGDWLNVPVRIPLRFSRFSSIFTPFFTQFSEDQYINFTAWDVQTRIWEKEGFANDYCYFYVEKDNPELKSFLRLKSFDTVSVLAKVTGIFRQKAYFRVTWVCHAPGTLDVDYLRLLNRGMKAFQNRKFDDAITIFRKILPEIEPEEGTPFPPIDIQMMLHKLIAKIHMYEKKDYLGAIAELERALLVNPKDTEAQELRMKCALCVQNKIEAPVPVYWEDEAEKKQQGKTEGSPEVKPEVKPITPPADIPLLPPVTPVSPKEEIR